MAYLKAVLLALIAAITLGAATGAYDAFKTAVEALNPVNKATVYSQGLSEAMYCAVLFAVVLAPVAVIIVFVRRRWRRRSSRTATP